MSKTTKERRRLVSVYGQLYRRISGIDWSKCYYCGDNSSLFDHVPPLVLTQSLDIEKFKKLGGVFLLIPACEECNVALGALPSCDLYERCDHVHAKFTKKAKHYDSLWEDDEIAELGPTLRSSVLGHRMKMHYYQTKADRIARLITDRFYIE